MQEKENIDDRVERALNSLDGTQRAQPSPWLYNRVLARMRKEEKSAWTQVGDFLARPAIAFGGLFIVLAINIIFLAGAHKDPVVPMGRSVNMVNAINSCKPAPRPMAKLTIYPGVKHNSWDNAYRPDHSLHNQNIYDWMMSYTNIENDGDLIPIAKAGSDQNTNEKSITLTGSGSDGYV